MCKCNLVILYNLIKLCNHTPSSLPIVPLLSDSVASFESGHLAARISAHSSSVNFLAVSLNSFFLCSANRPSAVSPTSRSNLLACCNAFSSSSAHLSLGTYQLRKKVWMWRHIHQLGSQSHEHQSEWLMGVHGAQECTGHCSFWVRP